MGSYNMQADWVRHADGLFLTDTRRCTDKDHVMRHWAPLFLGQVDTNNLTILRDTEIELVTNKGAQFGNFAFVYVNEHETWVTTSDAMAPRSSEKYGANGRVYAARMQWEKLNIVWNKH